MIEAVDFRQFKPATQDLVSIHPGFASALAVAHVDHEKPSALYLGSGPQSYMAARFGSNYEASNKPFPFHTGVAVIPIMGALLHRSMACWTHATGYDAIRLMYTAALADDDVKHIAYDMHSPGGVTNGNFELCEFLLANRGKKKVTALVDASCYSACYAIACTADRIIITPSAGVGSIGVLCMHVSVAGALERWGEEVKYLYAGKHKIDGNPYQKLSQQAATVIQKRVDALDKDFESLVARGRGLPEADVAATEAAVYYGKDAVDIGLADAVMPFHEAMTGIFNELSGSTQNEDYKMTQAPASPQPAASVTQDPKATQAAPAAAPAPAATPVAAATVPAADTPVVDAQATAKAERERIQAIMNSDEAKQNQKLANHLAFNTSMSVDDAKGMLKAAGASAPAADAPSTNALAEAMAAENANGHPQVPTDGSQTQTQTVNGADDLLRAYAAGTGIDLTKQSAKR